MTVTTFPVASVPVKLDRAVWSVGLPLHHRVCSVSVPLAGTTMVFTGGVNAEMRKFLNELRGEAKECSPEFEKLCAEMLK